MTGNNGTQEVQEVKTWRCACGGEWNIDQAACPDCKRSRENETASKALKLAWSLNAVSPSDQREFHSIILNPKKYGLNNIWTAGQQPEMNVAASPPSQTAVDPWQKRTLKDAFRQRQPATYTAGIFRQPSVSIVYGPPGSLKSMILADMAVCIASGQDWLPPAPWGNGSSAIRIEQQPVMWLDFDNGSDLTDERFQALATARNLPDDIPLTYYSMPSPWLQADDKASMGALIARIQEVGARLVVIDNLGDVLGGVEENSAAMAGVMSLFRQLAESTGAAIVIIHHQRKSNGQYGRSGDALRGHSSIEAALDLALQVEREEGSDIITLRSTKTRGRDVLPFSATFSYDHNDAGDLIRARFYGVQAEDTNSNRAIEAVITTALFGTSLNKTQLVKAVQDQLPGIGTNRVRDIIERLATNKRLIVTHRQKTSEKIYSQA